MSDSTDNIKGYRLTTYICNRCQITGVKCEVLSAVADWYEDTNNHTFVLKGFIYMDPKLKIARDGILADQPSPKWIQRLQNANK